MTSVTVSTSGEATVVTATTAGPQGADGSQGPRSMTIKGPLAGDNFTLFRPDVETTITKVSSVVSNGSVTYEIRYAANRQSAGTLATVSQQITSTTTGQSATVQNQPIPADNWVWVEITAVDGSVEEFSANFIF